MVGGVEGLELGDGVVPLPDQLVLGPVEPRVDTHSLAVVNRLGGRAAVTGVLGNT